MQVNDYNENYSTGWVSLYRSIQKHWIWNDEKFLKWWLIMLFEVNHSDNKITLGYEIYEVKKGQSAKSLRTWSTLFNTGTKSVSKFFTLLEKDSMITKETIGKGKRSTTLITIRNYTQYQGSKETQATTQGTTQGKHNRHTNNNVNKDNNDKINFKSLVDFINQVGTRSFTTINDSAKAKYKARLKEGYTKDDILRAIKNAHKEPYHIETKFKYLTPEFFSRADKLDLYSAESKEIKIDKLVLQASVVNPLQMEATCKQYDITPEQVKEMYASR